MQTPDIQHAIDPLYPVRRLRAYLARSERAWQTGDDPEAVAREVDENWVLIRELHARAADLADSLDEAGLLCCEFVVAAPTILYARLTRQEMIEWIELGLRSAESRFDLKAVGTLLTLRGIAERESQSLPAACSSFERAIECFRELQDEASVAGCLANLSILIAMRGDSQSGRDRLLDAQRYFNESRDRRGLLRCIGILSIVEQRLRLYASARVNADAYLELAQELGSRPDEIQALGQLGTCCRRLGSEALEHDQNDAANEYLELAIAYYRRQKELARECGDLSAQQRAIGNIGNAYSDLKRFDEAIACHRESLHLSTICGNPRACAVDQMNMGQVLLEMGRIGEAEEWFRPALAYSRLSNEPAFEAAVLANLSRAAERRQDLAEATKLLQNCLTIRESIRDPRLDDTRIAFSDLQARGNMQ